MSATINWRVGVMECYPTYEQNTDVVFTVHWDCLGSETVSGSTYNGRVYGATGVTFHSGSDFTPYENLIPSQVLGWVWDAMGSGSKENYENSVQSQINNLAASSYSAEGMLDDAQITRNQLSYGNFVLFSIILGSCYIYYKKQIKD